MQTLSRVNVGISLKQSVQKCLMDIGLGFEDCSPGEQILLKPNCNTADPFPASTSIDFLETVVEVLLDIGCDRLIIGDSSTMMLKTKSVMNQMGLFELEKRYGGKVSVLDFDKGVWIPTKISKGRYLKRVSLPEMLLSSDRLILLPCLKTHKIAQYTGALKLSVGLMRPQERVALHSCNLQEKIAELNTVIKPSLVIMDARKAFINNGPSHGEVVEPNLILASKSRVEIDTEGVNIIRQYENNSLTDTPPEKLIQIKYAKELGIK